MKRCLFICVVLLFISCLVSFAFAAGKEPRYKIVFQMPGYDTWLPTNGATVIVTPVFIDTGCVESCIPPLVSPFRYSVLSITNYQGKYTNHDSTDMSNDFDWTFDMGQLYLTSRDFGGSITIHAEVTVTPLGETPIIIENNFTLPKDTDADGLPDAWENQYGNLTRNGDIDTSVANTLYNGDGLTNFQEYRGFKWDNMELSSDSRYKTIAYVPAANISHFRTNPNRKDLFVKYTGYDVSNPFAIGGAFNEAGIDVHAVDATNSNLGENEIDVFLITNELVNTYQNADGHINHHSPVVDPVTLYTVRHWDWDTKGASGVGDSTSYGVATTTFQKPLDYYFSDKPYFDDTAYNVAYINKLDPLTMVDDKNDNGTNDKIGGVWEAGCQTCSLKGDRLKLPISYTRDLNPFDIDKNWKVELPEADDPNNINRNREYTKVQVLKHTITHEMGHAVGMDANHTNDTTCVMYKSSNNWSRDGHFCDDAKKQIQIHNN